MILDLPAECAGGWIAVWTRAWTQRLSSDRRDGVTAGGEPWGAATSVVGGGEGADRRRGVGAGGQRVGGRAVARADAAAGVHLAPGGGSPSAGPWRCIGHGLRRGQGCGGTGDPGRVRRAHGVSISLIRDQVVGKRAYPNCRDPHTRITFLPVLTCAKSGRMLRLIAPGGA